ncbi:glycoside hydrolase family 3 C-terminal domain-containing protein [Mucilaginibacter gotjawali]|uniref:Beta-glucosidase n=1 Tax=Mucilaginibacter gotjawali TaxID=1550579 RepID=A0A839SIJ1_9SPHI|nr:glycoside hydrolase family 3 C-terminal domain-containing protein [Mucilaginibacter gotjawali]MBB3056700.1 beta-glucosidase [Mucilaginibacter gotjawali]
MMMKNLTRYFKSIRLLAILLLLQTVCRAQSPAQNAPQLGKATVKQVIAAMTLEEKAKLLVGAGRGFGPPPPPPVPGKKDSAAKPAAPAGPMIGQTDQKVPGAAGVTYAIPRLGIPAIVVSDGPAGVRISPIRKGDSSKTYYATAFPVGTLLASSWDVDLVKQVGVTFGNEVREYGIDILLGPGMNIHRNPLGGRNFEYYSEDPLVTGKMAAAIVQGIQSNGVGTSIKHYTANNQETHRNTVNTIVSERAMREIYLRGFEIAVKDAQPWTVMTSYNKLNGTYTSERADLVTNILRNEWGFKGFVMTDWGGGRDPIAQMKAGNDLIMPGNPNQAKAIIDAVNSKQLDESVLNANVEHMLNIILKSPAVANYKYSDAPDLKKDAQVSRMAAAQGMVLLKNSGSALPFSGIKKVALFGNTGYDIIAGGTGSGNVNKAYTTSLAQGLQNAGLQVDDALLKAYPAYIAAERAKQPKPQRGMAMFMGPPPVPQMAIADADLQQDAANNDIAVITIGRNAGEGADRKLPDDYYLSDAEKALIKNVSEAFHAKGKKVVVVLNIGGVIEVASWRDGVDAILLAWQPGLEAGNAITDVLSGAVNPSGKLATTFTMDYKDVPSAKNFPGKEYPDQATGEGFRRQMPAEVTYEDGIYVGYRYYSTFKVDPAYEFGYGLSYTTFNYSNFKLSAPVFKGKLTASVTITNSGKVAGKEVGQLYLSAPAAKLDKPVIELKGFAKTRLLQPGESQTLSFTIDARALASYDTAQEAWVAEAGNYTASIGASSKDIKQTAAFKLAKEMVVEKDEQALAPQVAISELKSK